MIKTTLFALFLTSFSIAQTVSDADKAEVKEHAAAAQDALDAEAEGRSLEAADDTARPATAAEAEEETGAEESGAAEEDNESGGSLAAESADTAGGAPSMADDDSSAAVEANDEGEDALVPKPGKLAYKPRAAVGIAVGATLLGTFVSAGMMSAAVGVVSAGFVGGVMLGAMVRAPQVGVYTAELIARQKAVSALYYGGLILTGAALGFGPVLGQFLGLGKTAKYAIISSCVRTAASIILPLLIGTAAQRQIGEDDEEYSFTFMITSYLYGALIVLPAMAIWGIVDLALTKNILNKRVKKYEAQKKVQVTVAPALFRTGGGIMLGGRF